MAFKAILGSFCVITIWIHHVTGEEVEPEAREGKVLPIFQVVRFPNDVCDGGTRNGTCYTAEECSTKGGSASGDCASGFGVCCVFSLGCGSTANENSTYLVQAAATTIDSPCTYKVCKCSTDICRIRFDFNTFVIASPYTHQTTLAVATAFKTVGDSVGDCSTDSFVIASPGLQSSPVICGTNSGYHMIVDASDSCTSAIFNIGGESSTTRQWDIKVTQYKCGDEDLSGAPGCLQYYTATAGNIANFNFPPTATTVTSKVTHLSNQHYNICIRRAVGFCYICYSPHIAAVTGTEGIINQKSYGIGLSSINAAPGKSAVQTQCSTDYLQIDYGQTEAIAKATAIVSTYVHRYCGRAFATVTALDAAATVCTRNTPFIVGVNFDANEFSNDADDGTKTELGDFPGGIVGFKMTYFQRPC